MESKTPYLKFCGMTREEDIQAAVDLGADFVGFIFYRQSPRYITPAQVLNICKNIDFKTTQKIGVFVNTPLDEVVRIVHSVGLNLIQLHGNDDIDRVNKIKEKTNKVIWKTVRVKDKKSIEIIRQNQLDYFLIDTYSHNSYGGTGKNLDLNLVKASCQLQESTGEIPRKKIIVAGGINPENIATIIPYAPWGIDVNSGVELSPGIKDHKLMEAIVQSIKAQ